MYRQVFAGVFALMAATAVQAQTDPAARGKYLVEAIGGCNDCHSPMDQTGKVIPGRALTGAPLMFAPTVPMPWVPVAPPIAGGPAGYTAAQLASFLQTGVKPDGSMTKPPMPAFRLNAEDARAVTAYLMSLRPG
jgi:mono/diheme cytochrome c family protein